jgi:hypothetical protein
MRRLILIAMLAACGDDGAPGTVNVEVENPDEITTCVGGVQCEQACAQAPPDDELGSGTGCAEAKARTPGNDNDTFQCPNAISFSVNGEDGCCHLAADIVRRFYRCP